MGENGLGSALPGPFFPLRVVFVIVMLLWLLRDV